MNDEEENFLEHSRQITFNLLRFFSGSGWWKEMSSICPREWTARRAERSSHLLSSNESSACFWRTGYLHCLGRLAVYL